MLRKSLIVAVLALGLMSAVGLAGWQAQPSEAQSEFANPDMGYGFNMAGWDIELVQDLGFTWVKVFNTPSSRLPVNVMIRMNADASHMNDISGFRSEMRNAAQNSGDYIDAYEIGNEVNLDADYGWQTSPDAAQYVELLCAAYEEIKAIDPDAIVISAGLAPTGRVTGNWEGHAGHNGLFQDDHEYMREMLDAIIAKNQPCFDAVGYHNYGFDKAYDTSPDCENGFCFRGVEKIYEIMVDKGYGESKVWTTEFGWIVNPNEVGKPDCEQTLIDQGRGWQMVSLQEQSENIAGAFDYAARNWEWMGGLILFNLNFNTAGWYSRCEQMTFYSVEDRPSEEMLRNLPKAYAEVIPAPVPAVSPSGPTIGLATVDSPIVITRTLTIENLGDAPFTYTVLARNDLSLIPVIDGEVSAVVQPGEETVVNLVVDSSSYGVGTYEGFVTFNVTPEDSDFPAEYPMHLAVANELQTIYLPVVR